MACLDESLHMGLILGPVNDDNGVDPLMRLEHGNSPLSHRAATEGLPLLSHLSTSASAAPSGDNKSSGAHQAILSVSVMAPV